MLKFTLKDKFALRDFPKLLIIQHDDQLKKYSMLNYTFCSLLWLYVENLSRLLTIKNLSLLKSKKLQLLKITLHNFM